MSGMSHEFSAKTVDAAISEGLRQLGLSRSEVDIEVLHEGSRGLLGIGSTNARVRISKKPVAPPPPASVPVTPAPVEDVSVVPQLQEEAAMHISTPAVQTETAEEDGEVDPATAADNERVGQPDAEEVLAGAGASSLAHDSATTQVEDESSDTGYGEDYDEDEGQAYDYSDINREELAELAADLLGELLEHMGFEADVEASWTESQGQNSPLHLNVVGENLGMLIGRHGETLASIQYLIRLMINQKIHRWTNIVVDVDGYKARRAEQLTQMAQRMADQVVRTSRPVALEPMPANERRLVHIALRNHPKVYTESTGDADRRKVQILPK